MSSIKNSGKIRDSVVGDSNVVGDGNHVVLGSPEPDPQPFFVKKRRLLPVTERGINLVAALMTIATTFGLWRAAVQIWENSPFSGAQAPERAADTPLPGVTTQMTLVYVFLGLAVCWVIVMSLRRRIRSRTMGFSRSSLVPILAGVTDDSGRGRLALLRLGGRCEKQLGRGRCGGRLRFYNKPTEWIDYTISDGAVKRKITERTPAAECARNHKHWYPIDEADVD